MAQSVIDKLEVRDARWVPGALVVLLLSLLGAWLAVQTMESLHQMQRAEERADNGTEAAKQAGTAKHNGSNDLQFKAFALVGGAAAEACGNDHPRQRGGHSADDIDLHGHRFGVNPAASRAFGIRPDSRHVAAKAHMVENDMPDNQNHHADQRGHGDTNYPRASDKGKQAVSRHRNRVALGDQQRDAANYGQGGERDDKRRNALIGNKEAVDGTNESA